MNSETFTGKLVRLAAFNAEVDAEIAARWSRDTEYHRLSDDDPAYPQSTKQAKEWLEHDSDRHFNFMIRTLADDIGAKLGCGAHLIGLRRTETAGYLLSQAITIEQLEALSIETREALLLPVDSAIESLPIFTLNADAAYFLLQGQAVWMAGKIPNSDLRLYDENNTFLGLGFLQDDGKIAPKRLIQKTQSN